MFDLAKTKGLFVNVRRTLFLIPLNCVDVLSIS
jgi:hypothetical protein